MLMPSDEVPTRIMELSEVGVLYDSLSLSSVASVGPHPVNTVNPKSNAQNFITDLVVCAKSNSGG